LYCVYIAIGGISFLVSSLSDRRGRAIAVVFAIVLVSFLLNFIAQFWEPAKRFAHLSVMTYYQPALILRSGEIPSTNIAVLIAIGTLTWLVAGEVNRRRSICTV
jgi:ABC-2 type transport system permease protein